MSDWGSGRALRHLLGSAAMVSCVAVATPAFAQSRNFDVPAQSANKAISVFARQAGIQLIARAQDVRGKRTNTVRGSYSVEEALRLLLAGTGLQANRDASTGITTVRAVGNEQVASGESSASSEDGSTSAEIVVTGTNIRGQAPIGSKIEVITRSDIERSGYGRVQDLLTQSPLNFGANTPENPLGNNAGNLNQSQEIQLRGLGPGTTLVLVNGRRRAGGGVQGAFTDVSTIPSSAIERVEILPDGASALYGSDAIGGVVNFVLRKDLRGLETRFRIGTADGDATEYQASALWGGGWSSGNVILGADYYHRDALSAADRPITGANGDYRPFGGVDLRGIGGVPGTVYEADFATLIGAIPAGQDGTNLLPSQVVAGAVNYDSNAQYREHLPASTTRSVFLAARQELGAGVELELDGSYGVRSFNWASPKGMTFLSVPATNAYNRFGRPVVVRYDFSKEFAARAFGDVETINIAGGLNVDLSPQWRLRIGGSYSTETSDVTSDNFLINDAALTSALASSNPTTALNVFGNGTANSPAIIAGLAEDAFSHSRSRQWVADAVIDGTVVELPAGPLKVAIGGGFRSERVGRSDILLGVRSEFEKSRNVYSVFGEVTIPVMDGPLGVLIASAAGRHERYNDFGSTTNPKIGLSWEPIAGHLKFRGSWGTSFRAPPLYLGASGEGGFERLVVDPRNTATGRSWILIRNGADPDLHEERSEAWTLGAVISDPGLKGLSLEANWFHIDFTDKIDAPTFSSSQALIQEANVAALIARNPSNEVVNAICALPQYVGGCSNRPYAAVADFRTRNIASLVTSGLDVNLRYKAETDLGEIRLSAAGTLIFDYKTRLVTTSPLVDLANTFGNPAEFRGRGGLGWTRNRVSFDTALNFVGKTRTGIADARDIRSNLTFDASVAYELPRSILDGGTLRLSAINLFDADPPFVYPGDYDDRNNSILGRQISLSVVKRW